MDIKTKFKIGDTIYTIEKCKIREMVVKTISIYVDEYNEVDIRYSEQGYQDRISENEAFPSKEALMYHIQNS